jgi:hypothetical protein
MLLFRMYTLADGLGVEALANKLIGIYKLGRRDFPDSGTHLKYLIDHNHRSSKLLDIMLEQVAFDMWNQGGMEKNRAIYPDVFTHFLDVRRENSQMLLEKSLKMGTGASEISPEQRWLNCAWHTHEVTDMCEESEEEEGCEFNEDGSPLEYLLDSKAEELRGKEFRVVKRRKLDEW